MTGTHAFGDKETRQDDMSEAIEEWVEDLADGVEDAAASDEFTEYLDVMSNFHDYSRNNQFLIKLQCPEATKVAGFNTWRDDFDRTVKKGESAIWIWAPITARKCPECGNSEKYHNIEDCEYDDTDPEDWSTGVVGFRPVPVFDVSQTEGEPLPELDTETHGDADGLTDALLAAADNLDIPNVTITDAEEWAHGTAKGVSNRLTGDVDVRDRDNDADKATTIAHEFAHTMLHATDSDNPLAALHEDDDTPERTAREVEAEAVAYVFGRHFGLDVSGSEFYLASWAGDDTDEIKERLDRISKTAKRIISATEDALDDQADADADADPIPA